MQINKKLFMLIVVIQLILAGGLLFNMQTKEVEAQSCVQLKSCSGSLTYRHGANRGGENMGIAYAYASRDCTNRGYDFITVQNARYNPWATAEINYICCNVGS